MAVVCCNCCDPTSLWVHLLSSHTLVPDEPIVPNRSNEAKSIVSLYFKATHDEEPSIKNIRFYFPNYQLGLLYDFDFTKDLFASIDAYSALDRNQFLASANIQFGYRHVFHSLAVRTGVSIGVSQQDYSATMIEETSPYNYDTLSISAKPTNLNYGGSFLLHTNKGRFPVQFGLAINMNHVNCFSYNYAFDTLTAGLNTFAIKPFVVIDVTKCLYLILSIDNHLVKSTSGLSDFFSIDYNHYVPYIGVSVLNEF